MVRCSRVKFRRVKVKSRKVRSGYGSVRLSKAPVRSGQVLFGGVSVA